MSSGQDHIKLDDNALGIDDWLRQQRRRAVDILLRLIILFGILGLAYSLYRAYSAGRFAFTTVYYLVTYLIVLALYLWRGLGDQVRAIGVLALIYGFAVLALYSGWLAGGGRLFLLVLIPVSGILIGPRAGLPVAGVVMLTYIGYGLAFSQGWLTLATLPDPTMPAVVFLEGVGYLLTVVLMLASLWFLAQALNAASQARRQAEIAREQAEESERVKSQFLANVSHELRTPLNAIINFNQFVSSGLYGAVSERQVDALDKSTDSARHLLELINDVLDMSKIEAGRMDLFVEADVNLYPEFEAVAATTRTLLQGKPVAFLEEIEPDLPAIIGDRRRIRQILLNLTSNAAKFTREGHVKLSVWQESEHLLFAVEDTGPGIPPGQQEKIFQAFTQLRPGASRITGTGLGLPIAVHLAQAHGGRLWLESKLDEGATFFVILPVGNEALLQEIDLNPSPPPA